ncbi:restriction endonuclease subunit S [Clostridium kluyveri]|uniref:restriction endonuclease subunit S n=1 Tax=Clostridium kluyveri TaxID=1534 RepID=UPI002247FA9E|nr:restriction endonuclease subunit S [Clostridium kluyveri]UZQ52412.1 restriction endonuclease subunit S [Clostridium kluyveri]
MSKTQIMLEKPSAVWVSNDKIKEKVDANYMHYRFIELLDIKMDDNSNHFEVKENGDLINTLTDYTANGSFESLNKNVNYTNSLGIPFIRIKNMSENGLVLDDLKYIDTHTYNFLKKSKLEGNEILFSKTGANLGLAMVFPYGFGKASLADNIFKVEYKSEYDTHYIAAFINCKFGKLWVERLSQGSAQPTIIKDSFRQIKIPIPSSEIQKHIGDKVRRGEELREEAKRLREEAEEIINKLINLDSLIEKGKECTVISKWVDSINVRGRVDGQYYISPITEINKYMASTDVGLVSLKEVAKVGKGFSFSSDENIEGIPYVRISDLEDLLIDYSEVVNTDYKTYQQKKNAQLKEYDLVMAITGATIGKVSVFYSKEIEKATLSADTAYVRFNNPTDSIAYLLYLKTIIGQVSITQGITGATNKHLAIEDIKNIILPKFDEKIKETVRNKIVQSIDNIYNSKQLIQEAKQDIEDLIEGKFDMLKLNDTTTESR